ncbi:MAG: aspartate kinase [Bacteroidota bacterium]|nr:aspartate kinase [Bacteroidota bacterium]
MKVFKFGGGVIKDAESIKLLANILIEYSYHKIIVVISAMGKTTNALEEVINKSLEKDSNFDIELFEIEQYFKKIITNLYDTEATEAQIQLKQYFAEIRYKIEKHKNSRYDFYYDQIVGYGEIISSVIISNYLKSTGLKNKWIDARDIIKTTGKNRMAEILEDNTVHHVRQSISLEISEKLFITQGFIGADDEENMTTLGREGSDYSAAIIASSIMVEEVVFWKDVNGVFNADPKFYFDAISINEMSYDDVFELSKLGAKIIHQKTIQPLKEKNIPFEIRKFTFPLQRGTIIKEVVENEMNFPLIIKKENQAILTVLRKDKNTFTIDDRKILSKYFYKLDFDPDFLKFTDIKLITCIKDEKNRIVTFFNAVKKKFKLFYTKNVNLLIIKNHNDELIEELTKNKKILRIVKEGDRIYIAYRD